MLGLSGSTAKPAQRDRAPLVWPGTGWQALTIFLGRPVDPARAYAYPLNRGGLVDSGGTAILDHVDLYLTATYLAVYAHVVATGTSILGYEVREDPSLLVQRGRAALTSTSGGAWNALPIFPGEAVDPLKTTLTWPSVFGGVLANTLIYGDDGSYASGGDLYLASGSQITANLYFGGHPRKAIVNWQTITRRF